MFNITTWFCKNCSAFTWDVKYHLLEHLNMTIYSRHTYRLTDLITSDEHEAVWNKEQPLFVPQTSLFLPAPAEFVGGRHWQMFRLARDSEETHRLLHKHTHTQIYTTPSSAFHLSPSHPSLQYKIKWFSYSSGLIWHRSERHHCAGKINHELCVIWPKAAHE